MTNDVLSLPTNFQIVRITRITDRKVHFEMINDKVNLKYKGNKGYWTFGNVINDQETIKWFMSNPTGVWLAWTYKTYNGKRVIYTLMTAPVCLDNFDATEQRTMWLTVCKPFNDNMSKVREHRSMTVGEIYTSGKVQWEIAVTKVNNYFDKVEKVEQTKKLINELWYLDVPNYKAREDNKDEQENINSIK